MIYAEKGKEQDSFIAFVEYALGILAKDDYATFLSLFDSSRLTEQELILALTYLDETRPILKIDDPALVKSKYLQWKSGTFVSSRFDEVIYFLIYDTDQMGTEYRRKKRPAVIQSNQSTGNCTIVKQFWHLISCNVKAFW